MSQSTLWIQTTSRTGKGWGVVFVCTATPLVSVEMTQSYSTDSFLMALRRFKAKHGAQRRFQSNQCDQLVAADCHMGLVRGGCAVQSDKECHLEASSHWGPALQWTERKNHRIGDAVPGADTGQEGVKY